MSDELTYQEYREGVNTIAEEIAEGMRKGEITDQGDAVHERVDSDSWVIYTGHNFDVLRHCSNSDAYTDDFGEVPTVGGGGINWAALAYAALAQDVNDALSRLNTEYDDEEETCACGNNPKGYCEKCDGKEELEEEEGTEGQDRESYSDTQDRENYNV